MISNKISLLQVWQVACSGILMVHCPFRETPFEILPRSLRTHRRYLSTASRLLWVHQEVKDIYGSPHYSCNRISLLAAAKPACLTGLMWSCRMGGGGSHCLLQNPLAPTFLGFSFLVAPLPGSQTSFPLRDPPVHMHQHHTRSHSTGGSHKTRGAEKVSQWVSQAKPTPDTPEPFRGCAEQVPSVRLSYNNMV